MITPERTVRTTCPYCGVGCQLNLNIKDDYIYAVEAPFDAAPTTACYASKGASAQIMSSIQAASKLP
ncbi:MAG: hypothetical protein M5U34_08610 [Chloroflexi bacterium]|nr:hypothetical protein [Chloroflexota bacterium]